MKFILYKKQYDKIINFDKHINITKVGFELFYLNPKLKYLF